MIQNIAEADRRHATRILHEANEGRLFENELIYSPNLAVEQRLACKLNDLGWMDLILDQSSDDDPYFRLTPDGSTALKELQAWCQANPIRVAGNAR